MRRLRALKRSLGIDLCISHLEGADIVNLLGGGLGRTVVVVHGSKAGDPNMIGLRGRVRRSLMGKLYNRADRVVTVSRDIAPELVDFGIDPARIATINNFFDIARIEALAQEALPPVHQPLFDDVPVLITAGRLAMQKNQMPLLEIAAALKTTRRFRLLLLGDGELRDELLAKARQLGLRSWETWSGEPLEAERDVYFLGTQENPFRYLRRANLFLFPSRWEGFPLALCEAMVCGVPVVTTDCLTGPREILAPRTRSPAEPIRAAERTPYGVLMPTLHSTDTLDRDQAAWVTEIGRLLDEPSTRDQLSRQARERMSDFTRQRIGPEWFALVDDVLGRRRQSAGE